jgi:D-glucosaminate-6-phosphate ammonia-lyase
MKRRDVIKGLTLLPFAGSFVGSPVTPSLGAPFGKRIDWYSKSAAPGPLKIGPDIYQSIGVEPVINCMGTFTIIGASVVRPEARAAMDFAHQYNTQLDELAFGVGQRLAELTGAEWGVVGSGCAGGLKLVAAACISGGCPDKLIRIPMETSRMEKNEVVCIGGGSVYDHGIRLMGVKMIRNVTPETLSSNLNSRTAMIYMGGGNLEQISQVAKIAKPMGIPIVCDNAASAPIFKPNPILAAGADVVSYSGGKCICGPQSAGLLLGKKDLLLSAWQASAPHHGPCRDNKVGREEQIGMLAAVESWVSRDHVAEMKTWVSWCDDIAKRVSAADSVHTIVRYPAGLGNPSPTVTISWDPKKLNLTGREMVNTLATTKPRIGLTGGDLLAAGAAGGGRGGAGGRGAAAATVAEPQTTNPWAAQLPARTIVPAPAENTAFITVAVYQMGEQTQNVKIVGDRIYEILSTKRSAIASEAPMKAPVANIVGRWDVTVKYFSSTNEQMFNIEKQEGNFLLGNHKGESTTRELLGTIDGDKVIFTSRYTVPGDVGGVTYTFYGTVSGDNMTGDIDMGEYITAKFTAKKHTYPQARQVINVPVGRPLSS